MSRPLYPKSWHTEYTCSHCGFRAQVEFVDPAGFTEDEPIGGRDKWAQQAALEAAQNKLAKRGRRALRLLPCPGCRRRDEQAVRQAYLWAALPLLGAVPAAFLITMIVAAQLLRQHAQPLGPGSWAAIVTGVVAVAVVWRGQRRLLAEAKGAVRFAQPETKAETKAETKG